MVDNLACLTVWASIPILRRSVAAYGIGTLPQRSGRPVERTVSVAKKDSPRKTTGKPGKTSATAARLKGPANKAVAAGPLKLGRAGPRLTKSPLSKAELAEFREMLLEKRRSIDIISSLQIFKR